jgi:hypothetical protein
LLIPDHLLKPAGQFGAAMQTFMQAWVSDASTVLSSAQHILDLYSTTPFLSVIDPPLTHTIVQGSGTAGLPPAFLEIVQQQLPAPPAYVVKAAAVVAAATGDEEVAELLLRGVSAVQRGHLKYDGDVTSLECLR